MYPYPSGDLHIGHWYVKTPTDALARFHRMNGENVFLPIGFDAFGLPAENAAIKRGIHPREWTMGNIETMRRQLRTMGAAFDWSSEVVTCEPDYYRWNQWLFLQLLKAGLAYRTRSAGRLVPQRRDAGPRAGRGRRSALLALRRQVEKRDLEQWFLRITRTPTSCSTSPASTGRSRSASCRRTGSAAPRAPRSTSRPPPTSTSPAATCCASSRRARTRSSGRRSWSWPRSTRWSSR